MRSPEFETGLPVVKPVTAFSPMNQLIVSPIMLRMTLPAGSPDDVRTRVVAQSLVNPIAQRRMTGKAFVARDFLAKLVTGRAVGEPFKFRVESRKLSGRNLRQRIPRAGETQHRNHNHGLSYRHRTH